MKRNKFRKLTENKSILWLILLGVGYSMTIYALLFFTGLISEDIILNYLKDISRSFSGSFGRDIFEICIIAPILEELLFRGAVMNLLKRFLPYRWANLLQALIFGIMHFNIVQGIYAFALGLILGYIYNKFGTLYSDMIVHMSVNTVGGFLFPALMKNILYDRTDNIAWFILAYSIVLCLGMLLAWIPYQKIKDFDSEKMKEACNQCEQVK